MNNSKIDLLGFLDPVIRDPHSGEQVDFDQDINEARSAVSELLKQLDTYLKGQQEETDSDYHWIRRERLKAILDRIQSKE